MEAGVTLALSGEVATDESTIEKNSGAVFQTRVSESGPKVWVESLE